MRSGLWGFILGSVVSAATGTDATPVQAFKGAADRLFGGFGWIAVLGLLVGLLSCMAINHYSGMMSMISIRDSVKAVTPSRCIRAIAIGIMFVLVWASAQFVGVKRFNTFYGNVLIFLAYLFTPWTVINLIDYFFVRRGAYVIKEIFRRDGIYGRWGWRGNLAYAISMATMVPFMVTAAFVGFAATALGGVDYSIFIGLPVAAGAYLFFCRDLDLATERRMVDEEGVLPVAH